MSINGIWTTEVYGPFGWDNRGVFVLEEGRIIGGDNRQYTVGLYTLSTKKRFKAELMIHYYGPPRTIFGEAREEFATKITGKLKKDQIEGTVSRPDKPQFDLQIRMTKRMGLPGA
jgi:hypothetical protein